MQLRTINRKIEEIHPGYELVKGEGYFYIDGPNVEMWYTTSIPVSRLNNMTMEQWLDAISSMINRETKRS